MYVSGEHHLERKKQYVPAMHGLKAWWVAGRPVCKCRLEDDTKNPIFIEGDPGEIDVLFLEALKKDDNQDLLSTPQRKEESK